MSPIERGSEVKDVTYRISPLRNKGAGENNDLTHLQVSMSRVGGSIGRSPGDYSYSTHLYFIIEVGFEKLLTYSKHNYNDSINPSWVS